MFRVDLYPICSKYLVFASLPPLGWHCLNNSIGQHYVFPFLDIWVNAPGKSQYVLSVTSFPYTMYTVVSVVLGGINYCFGVTYSVLSVIYALTFVEHNIFLLFLRCNFSFRVASRKYVRTASGNFYFVYL